MAKKYLKDSFYPKQIANQKKIEVSFSTIRIAKINENNQQQMLEKI